MNLDGFLTVFGSFLGAPMRRRRLEIHNPVSQLHHSNLTGLLFDPGEAIRHFFYLGLDKAGFGQSENTVSDVLSKGLLKILIRFAGNFDNIMQQGALNSQIAV
jgi:hypothetical protein